MTSTVNQAFTLKANLRNVLGSAESRRIRKAGQLPAIIRIKNGTNLNVVVDAKELSILMMIWNILITLLIAQ